MNSRLDRQLIVELIIIVALIVGGWSIFVEPTVAQLRQVKSTIAQSHLEPLATERLAVAEMADQVNHVRQRVQFISAHNEFASNLAHVYSVIKDRAAAHDVTVESVSPGPSRRDQGNGEGYEATSFEMSIEGRYEQIAAFLRAMDQTKGFVRPVQLRLIGSSANGQAMVRGELLFENLRFVLPEPLATLAGATDVHP